MKAVVVPTLGGPGVLSYEAREAPVPGPGQVLIVTAVTSVKLADIKARQGAYGRQVLPFQVWTPRARSWRWGRGSRVNAWVNALLPIPRAVLTPNGF